MMKRQGVLFLGILLLALTFWLGTLFETSKQTTLVPADTLIVDSKDTTPKKEASLQPRLENKLIDKCQPIAGQPGRTASTSSSNLQAIENLQQQVKELTETLAGQEVTLDQQNNRYNRAVTRLREEGISVPGGISLNEASELLPEPFNQVIANAGPRMTDDFKDLHTQQQDYDWAIRMQQQIQDYFATHEVGHLVQLNAVMCKATLCEVRGFESQRGVWEVIMKSLSTQDWWNAFSTSNVSGDNSEKGRYFYLLARFPIAIESNQND